MISRNLTMIERGRTSERLPDEIRSTPRSGRSTTQLWSTRSGKPSRRPPKQDRKGWGHSRAVDSHPKSQIWSNMLDQAGYGLKSSQIGEAAPKISQIVGSYRVGARAPFQGAEEEAVSGLEQAATKADTWQIWQLIITELKPRCLSHR